jgi:hypothetical protein
MPLTAHDKQLPADIQMPTFRLKCRLPLLQIYKSNIGFKLE